MIALRNYQLALAEDIRSGFADGAKAVLAVSPVGSGKTVLFSYVSAGASSKGKRVVVLAHRRELVKQASEKLTASGVPHGIIAPGFSKSRELVQVTSVQTLANREIDEPHLFVADEAHHAVAGAWAKIFARYPKARILGVTASPVRQDGKGLGVSSGGPFDHMVVGPAVEWLTGQGFLSPVKIYAPLTGPDLRGVATRAGDYDVGQVGKAMDKPRITGDAVSHYAKHAPGQPCIAFCASIEHATHTAAAFAGAGWRSVAVSGKTPTPERDAAIGGLATGAVQVLCSCSLIDEGLDVPAVGCVIMLRPTKSLGLYIQQAGRGMRVAPGKSALILLDHAGNTNIHGLPSAAREWSLDTPKKKAAAPPVPAVKQCPGCWAIHAPRPSCPECGHTYVAKARKVEYQDGDLQEVDQEAIRAARLADLMTTVKSRSDLQAIAKARGFKPGWVWHASLDLRKKGIHV
jgi:DNA repair protein RadD